MILLSSFLVGGSDFGAGYSVVLSPGGVASRDDAGGGVEMSCDSILSAMGSPVLFLGFLSSPMETL